MLPLALYVRAHLHRRLFAWFAVAILLTGLVHMGIYHVYGSGDEPSKPPVFLPLLLSGVVLWLAAGKIAYRLARPIADIARVAHEIGQGKLKSRAELSCRTPDEVGVLASAINDMAQRIERQLNDQRVLLAQVSHEMRTPLGHLRVLVELLRENGPDKKMLDDLEREIVEMDALVGELLASSRLDFQAASLLPLAAVEIGRRAVDRAGLPAETLQVDIETGDEVQGDATLLGRALANLIDNANKHGGGLASLKVEAHNGEVIFEAEDRGSGIPAGDEERIFEPFYRAKNGANGTLGLGLSLVRRIAEAHGGRAYAMPREGGGARVGFTVPRAEKQLD